MARIARYGAYLPKYRVALGEIQAFEGRPGRPRSKTLAIPALDEDTLTMAWEASSQAIGSGPAPTTIIAVTQSSPTGFRKMSQTLARALDSIDDPDRITCYDLAANTPTRHVRIVHDQGHRHQKDRQPKYQFHLCDSTVPPPP